MAYSPPCPVSARDDQVKMARYLSSLMVLGFMSVLRSRRVAEDGGLILVGDFVPARVLDNKIRQVKEAGESVAAAAAADVSP